MDSLSSLDIVILLSACNLPSIVVFEEEKSALRGVGQCAGS